MPQDAPQSRVGTTEVVLILALIGSAASIVVPSLRERRVEERAA